MALATLALTWMCLAQSPSPLPGDVAPLTKRSFPIPINIEEGRRAEIRQLILFGSDDQGQTWNQVTTATPDQTSFPFTARHDGLYWFSVGVVDQQGKQQPDSPYSTAPALKVLIDTVVPILRIVSADRQGDEAVVCWEIQEERPDFGTLRLEYRSADGAAWTPVPFTATGLTGRMQFRPGTSAALTVRMEIKDQVGNVGTAQKEVPAAPAPVASLPANPGNTAPAPYPVAAATPLDRQASIPSPVGRPDPLPATDHSNYVPNSPPPYPPANYPTPSSLPAGAGNNEMRAIAYSGTTDAAPPGSAFPAAHHGSLPRPQLVNDPHVGVDYTVTEFGASGVGKVELWVTADDGATWRYLTDDPEVIGRDPGQKQHLMAVLPGEGVFGLRLVTQSGAGLGHEPPRPGDAPELRIEVDTTPPLVKLFEPRPDAQQRDTLVLSWSAQDRNLAAKPISLEYAEQPDGPWQPIAANLPNSGSYGWVPKNVPYRAFLRVTAVDTAGNRSTAQAREPSLIDLNKPKGHLLGIAVHPRTPPEDRKNGIDPRP